MLYSLKEIWSVLLKLKLTGLLYKILKKGGLNMSEAHDLSGFMVDPSVEALVYINLRGGNGIDLDGFDGLYIAIVNRLPEEVRLYNLEKNGLKILGKWFDKEYLYKMINNGFRQEILEFINHGEVLFDRNKIINNIKDFSKFVAKKNHQIKLGVEFSQFLKSFTEAKKFLNQGKLIDSFHYCSKAINRWAHLAIIENGQIPNERIWEQVQRIDYTVYKLYEELSTSLEPLNKRIELFLLASEFALMSKLKECTVFLIDIIHSKNDSWTLNELYHHPTIKNHDIELILLLDKLVKRSLINEVKTSTMVGIEKKYIGISNK